MKKKSPKNTIEKSRIWKEIDKPIVEHVQWLICQLQRTTKIKNQAEAVISDIPTAPNEKISLYVFGRLIKTAEGNKFILSLQDWLTRYTILLPLKNEATESIITELIEHFFCVFEKIKNSNTGF